MSTKSNIKARNRTTDLPGGARLATSSVCNSAC